MNYQVLTKQLGKNKMTSKYVLLAISFFMYATVFSQETSNKDAGVFAFETEEIDYGTINQNDDGIRTFKFTNKGSTPIIITDIKTSCGCTVPTVPKKPILPGETGEIEIKYATNRVGAFSKTITVISNADEQRKLLRIKGNVVKRKLAGIK